MTRGAFALEPVVAETPLLERADLEVLDQHVALRDQPGEDLLPRLHRHVERHRALVAVHAEEIRGLLLRERRAPGARVVARARRLDLDHVGAHVAEHHRAERPREDAREIEHAQPVERAGCSSIPRGTHLGHSLTAEEQRKAIMIGTSGTLSDYVQGRQHVHFAFQFYSASSASSALHLFRCRCRFRCRASTAARSRRSRSPRT